MAEFKRVFELVSSNILDAQLSVDEFLQWLSQKKSGGGFLENWTVEEMQSLIEEFKRIEHKKVASSHFENSDAYENSQDSDDHGAFEEPTKRSRNILAVPSSQDLKPAHQPAIASQNKEYRVQLTK